MGIVRHRSQDSGDAERAMKTNPNQSLRRLRLRLERGRGLRCEDLKSDIQKFGITDASAPKLRVRSRGFMVGGPKFDHPDPNAKHNAGATGV